MALLVFLGVESLRKSSVLSDPPPQDSQRAAEVQDRLDPNVADAAALSAIPELGEKRAEAIVEYREWFLPRYPGRRAFDSADDLIRIKGFGLSTVASVGPYLAFSPAKSAATRPSGTEAR